MLVRSHNLPPDKPITLQEACDKVFGDETITVSSLKAEMRRGNLDVSKIGRAYFTTPAAIDEMMQRCRVKAQAPTLRSTKAEARGRLSTGNTKSALASAKLIAERLKRRSKPT